MKFSFARLPFIVVALITVTACSTTIVEPTEYVYPVTLGVPRGIIVIGVGSNYGIGVSAMIVGRDGMEAGDSIGVTIRDEKILRRSGDSGGRYNCTTSDGMKALCLHKTISVDAIKDGETYIVFRMGGRRAASDSVRVLVQNLNQKG